MRRSGFLKPCPPPAFTLAELLIALAILGVIAVFTIPKVLQSQTDGKYKAITKEAVATVSSAFSAYQSSNRVTGGTGFSAMSQTVNYVRIDTVSTIDDGQGPSTMSCADGLHVCLVMHNGGILTWYGPENFGGTGTTNALWFLFDPDGKAQNTANGRLVFFLYANGRIKTSATIDPHTASSASPDMNPVPGDDPSWFSWN